MKQLVLSISFIFSFNLSAQQSVPFHSLCNQACKAIEDGATDQSFILLTEAFRMKQFKPRAADYLNMAKCYSQQNNSDLTEKYIYLALERNPNIGRAIRIHNLWFEPVIGSEKWQKLLAITQQEIVVSEDAKRVIAELKTIDSLNLQSYFRYQKQLDPFKPIDTILYKTVWDSVCRKVERNIPRLDSVLLSLPTELLTNSSIEGAFLKMTLTFRPIIFKQSKGVYLKLIDKGFLTPDLLLSLFIEEHFKEDTTFNFLRFSYKDLEFYDKYGVCYDYNMREYRLFNQWYYDLTYD